mmetsp:Transcript_89954/g.160097  ORF Transcript_89954/g.160097 Transcript_89954/m.160097 type:complete len:653 (+) Transcript_89954:47-2005(+)
MAEPESTAVTNDAEEKDEPTSLLTTYFGLFIADLAVAILTILLSGAASWQLGVTILVFHCFGSSVIAANLDDKRIMRPISNLLWVQVCILILVIGSWISVRALGEWETLADQQEKVNNLWDWPDSMKAWADESDPAIGAGEIVYNGTVFLGAADSEGRRILSRTEPDSSLTPVLSLDGTGLLEAHSFAEWNGSLYFFAADYDAVDNNFTGPESLWAIAREDAASGDARLVKAFDSYSALRSIYVQNTRFWFKAYVSCSRFTSETFFKSDGTENGTVDMNEDSSGYSDMLKICKEVSEGKEVVPPLGRILGVFFLGVLPQTGLAAFLLYLKQMPGLVMNIYGGVYSVIVLIWLMSVDDLGRAADFVKATSCLYSGFAYLGLIQLKMGGSPVWLTKEMRDWAAVIVSLSFFAALHFAIGIPTAEDAGTWIFYAVMLLVQMVLALLLRSGVAVALPVSGLFVLSWKIADSAISAWAPDLSDSMHLMIVFPILCILGLVVIVVAVFCIRNRRVIEAETKEFFFPTTVTLEDVELENGTMFASSSRSREAWSAPAPPPVLAIGPSPVVAIEGGLQPTMIAEDAFASADTDGDGVVTQEELQTFTQMQEMPVAALMQLQKLAMESQGLSGGKELSKLATFDPFRADAAESEAGSDEEC